LIGSLVSTLLKLKELSVQVYFTVLLFLFSFLPSNTSADSSETYFSVNPVQIENTLISSLPTNAKWSFSALSLGSGSQTINAGNAKALPLVPGSLMKLFIVAAVLDMDSKEKIQMNTIVACDGLIFEGKLRGSLYLKGSGNAFLSERDMESAAEEIFSRGIKEITGNIIADDSLFDIKGWNSYYQGPAYVSPGSLGLDLHTINVFGRPPNIKVEPPNDDVKVSFVPDRKPGIRQIDDLTYEIRGEISESGIFKKRFALQDPATYAALTFKTLLREKGINLKGTVRRGETPPHATEIFRIKAKDLREIIKDTNNNSLNVVAENLLLLIGAKRFGSPGTVQKGIKAVYEFISEIDLLPSEVSLADGSGLSPDNRITSEQLVIFLKKVSETRWFNAFWESLPRVGIDGTLKKAGYVNEHIRAKSGQLNGVYCLAGYIEREDKSLIAFSYMVNVPGADLFAKDTIGFLLATLAGKGS